MVPIIMGSKADLAHGQIIAAELKDFGIDSEIRVASAHKVAKYLLELLAGYEAGSKTKVYITIAGRSNALSGLIDAHVSAPVIACPPPSEAFGGADVFSSLRMPSGVTPAVVLEPKNAALLAAKIIGTNDAKVRERVKQKQAAASDQVIADDKALNGLDK